MTRSQFLRARRAAGVEARQAAGSTSLYSERDAQKILAAFHHQHRQRAHSAAAVDELKRMIKESGY